MQEVPGSSPGASTNPFSRARKGFSGFPTQLSAARWIIMGQSAGQSIGWTADDSRGCVPPRKGRIAKLITRRVEGSNPSPRIFPHAEKGFRKRANSSGALGPVVNLHFHLHLRSWRRAVGAGPLPVIRERGALRPGCGGRQGLFDRKVIRPLSSAAVTKGCTEVRTFG